MSKEDALLRELIQKIVWPEEKFDRIIELLTDIKGLLTVAPPPAGAVNIANLNEIKAMIIEAIEQHGALKRANDLYVKTIDLSTARGKPTEMADLAPPGAIAMTIFRNTGSFDLYLQKAEDTRKFTIDALTYPQNLLIDWFDFEKVYIVNTAQSGLSATIIVWKKT